MPFSYPTPELEGRSNLTSLDIQIKKLRDNTLKAMKDSARRMREEAREPRDTVTDIETWAEKLKVLAEEVQLLSKNEMSVVIYAGVVSIPDVLTFSVFSPRTACLM